MQSEPQTTEPLKISTFKIVSCLLLTTLELTNSQGPNHRNSLPHVIFLYSLWLLFVGIIKKKELKVLFTCWLIPTWTDWFICGMVKPSHYSFRCDIWRRYGGWEVEKTLDYLKKQTYIQDYKKNWVPQASVDPPAISHPNKLWPSFSVISKTEYTGLGKSRFTIVSM